MSVYNLPRPQYFSALFRGGTTHVFSRFGFRDERTLTHDHIEGYGYGAGPVYGYSSFRLAPSAQAYLTDLHQRFLSGVSGIADGRDDMGLSNTDRLHLVLDRLAPSIWLSDPPTLRERCWDYMREVSNFVGKIFPQEWKKLIDEGRNFISGEIYLGETESAYRFAHLLLQGKQGLPLMSPPPKPVENAILRFVNECLEEPASDFRIAVSVLRKHFDAFSPQAREGLMMTPFFERCFILDAYFGPFCFRELPDLERTMDLIQTVGEAGY